MNIISKIRNYFNPPKYFDPWVKLTALEKKAIRQQVTSEQHYFLKKGAISACIDIYSTYSEIEILILPPAIRTAWDIGKTLHSIRKI